MQPSASLPHPPTRAADDVYHPDDDDVERPMHRDGGRPVERRGRSGDVVAALGAAGRRAQRHREHPTERTRTCTGCPNESLFLTRVQGGFYIADSGSNTVRHVRANG